MWQVISLRSSIVYCGMHAYKFFWCTLLWGRYPFQWVKWSVIYVEEEVWKSPIWCFSVGQTPSGRIISVGSAKMFIFDISVVKLVTTGRDSFLIWQKWTFFTNMLRKLCVNIFCESVRCGLRTTKRGKCERKSAGIETLLRVYRTSVLHLYNIGCSSLSMDFFFYGVWFLSISWLCQ